MSNEEILKKAIEKAVKNGLGGEQNKKYWLNTVLAEWLEREQLNI